MKRIFLFVATNLAVVIVMSVMLSLLGINRFISSSGLNLTTLLAFSLVVGFTGAVFSLLISKPMAKWSTGARVIDAPSDNTEMWLISTVQNLSSKAGIGMPEVAIYEGAPNAFATGAFKNSALVAVSTGLLTTMSRTEVEAVLGHEISHVANGDMVTMTLIQGVINTFVIFLARVVGYLVDKLFFKNGDEDRPGFGYILTVFVCELVFGFLASMIVFWFSRQREFRADAGSATLLGNANPMIQALEKLSAKESDDLPKALSVAGICDKAGIAPLFSSHPPIEQRIAALRGMRN